MAIRIISLFRCDGSPGFPKAIHTTSAASADNALCVFAVVCRPRSANACCYVAADRGLPVTLLGALADRRLPVTVVAVAV